MFYRLHKLNTTNSRSERETLCEPHPLEKLFEDSLSKNSLEHFLKLDKFKGKRQISEVWFKAIGKKVTFSSSFLLSFFFTF